MTDNIPRFFIEEEVRGIREGIDGVYSSIPARFYYDEEIFQFEVEHILKKSWLCVGRQDEAENPGDYFTTRLFDEPIVIVRDKKNELHALINVCQHRWAQVVDDGSGNANMFTCPFHRWTYNLDGTLRGISTQDIPGVDKKQCRMPELRLEVWQGFIYINFDENAKPYAPQLAAITPHMERIGMGDFRVMGSAEIEASWNWKFTIEAGMEGYHHVGLHHDRINGEIPSDNTVPLDFGESCGSYRMWWVDGVPEEYRQPFGTPPGKKGVDWDDDPRVLCAYPNWGTWMNNYQTTYHVMEIGNTVTPNKGKVCQAFPPWAISSANAEEAIKAQLQFAKDVQEEDSFACRMLQKGITSKSNKRTLMHPLERQMNHYHNWYLNQFLNA